MDECPLGELARRKLKLAAIHARNGAQVEARAAPSTTYGFHELRRKFATELKDVPIVRPLFKMSYWLNYLWEWRNEEV